MRKFFIILLLSCKIQFICAQTLVYEPLTQGEVNRVLNSVFNKLASTHPNPGEIASYASIDPVNAAFNLKTTFPLQPGRRKKLKDPDKTFSEKLTMDFGGISYLSFNVNGGLIDKNYAVLFSDSKLNAGINAEALYNFRIGKPRFAYFDDEWSMLALKRDQLFQRYYQNIIAAEAQTDESAYQLNKRLLEIEDRQLSQKAGDLKRSIDLLKKSIDSLRVAALPAASLEDSLQAKVKKYTSVRASITQNYLALDSMARLQKYGLYSKKISLVRALNQKLQKEYDTLMAAAALIKHHTVWFTIIGGYSRKSYNTFNGNLPFDEQLQDNIIDGFKGGLAFNYLFQDRVRNRSVFLNITGLRQRTSNIGYLKATSIDQARRIIDSTGSVVRTLSSKIQAYEDPVTDKMAWSFAGHFYYLFGKRVFGFHVFPSVDFMHVAPSVDLSKDIKAFANLTFGFIMPFMNAAKNQPAINAEFYLRFNDLTNSQNLDSKFYSRNEIGISFTLPFNFL